MRKRMSVVAWVLLAGLAAASADVVALKNGKRYTGKVISQGDTIKIKVDYAVLEFPKSEVLVVAIDEATAGDEEPIPADSAEPSTTAPPAEDLSAAEPLGTQVSRPEPLVFYYQRGLAAATSAAEKVTLRKQLRKWQAAAHDRKRKVGPRWSTPAEFVRARKAYKDLLDQAEDFLGKARRRTFGDRDEKITSEQRKALMHAHRLLDKAAASWEDPLLRGFLLGVADYQKGRYGPAETHFRTAAEQAPHVAMFHQGRALALLGLERYDDAIAALGRTLDLRPDSKECIQLVREAMKRIPGAKIRKESFQELRKRLARYEKGRGGRFSWERLEWLAPDDEWRSQEGSLPEPEFDRLDFRQCIGVPVGPQSLLVDAQAVGDAAAVCVLIDGQRIATARTRRSYGSRGSTDKAVLLTVPGWRFTPLSAIPAEGDKLPEKLTARAASLPLYRQTAEEPLELTAVVNTLDRGAIEARVPAGYTGAVLVSTEETPRVVGFLAGRTNVLDEDGGAGEFVPVAELEKLISRAQRASRYSGRLRTLKDDAEPQTAEGHRFVVIATVPETFKE